MNSKDTHNVIFSLVSVGGATLCNLPDGNQLDLFGQGAVLANLFQLQENKKEKTMNDTFGQLGLNLSGSASLQQFLESKLAQQLPMDGWMKSRTTWKQKDTPSGRRYCQLAVSVRRTKETDCGLWATPNTMDHIGDRSQEAIERQFQTTRKGRTSPANLREQVNPAMWPTPRAFCYKDAKTDRGKSNLGEIVNSFNAQTENKGSLNPQFVYWLMGYPKEWVCSVQQGMQLCPKSPRSSSKRSKKV